MRILLISLLTLFLSACATAPQGANVVLSATQVQQKVCSIAQPVALSVTSDAKVLNPPLSQSQQEKLDKANSAVNGFCSLKVASTQDAQDAINNAVPLLIDVVANSSLNDSTRSAVLLSIVGAQTAINVIISQNKGA